MFLINRRRENGSTLRVICKFLLVAKTIGGIQKALRSLGSSLKFFLHYSLISINYMPLRKLIIILLSFCFLLNITGYHIIFYLRQEEIKSEMRAAIRLQSYNAQETDFVFSVNDRRVMDQLGWEGDDEFSFKGEMYDVIEKKIEDGKLIIRSIADRRETALLNTIRGHWNQNEKSNKVADELFQLLQSLFHSSKTEEFGLIKPLVHRMSFISFSLPSQVIKIPTPPPRC